MPLLTILEPLKHTVAVLAIKGKKLLFVPVLWIRNYFFESWSYIPPSFGSRSKKLVTDPDPDPDPSSKKFRIQFRIRP
jgi:hypothetical protein